MFHKTLAWYRSLRPAWRWIAWIAVAVIAVVSFVVFVIPWIANASLRDKVRALQADAAVTKAKYQIETAKKKVAVLEAARNQSLAKEAELALEDAKLDDEIADVSAQLEQQQKKVEVQTDEQQNDFFNKRYRD